MRGLGGDEDCDRGRVVREGRAGIPRWIRGLWGLAVATLIGCGASVTEPCAPVGSPATVAASASPPAPHPATLPEPPSVSGLRIVRQLGPIGGAIRIRHLGDGRRLATISDALDVWDLSTRTVIHHLSDPGVGTFMDIALVPRTDLAVTSAGRGKIVLWDLDQGVRVREYPKHGLGADVAVSPDGTQLLVSGANQVKLVELATGAVLLNQPLPGAWNAVGGFAPTGPFVAWEEHRRLIIWDVLKRRRRSSLALPQDARGAKVLVTERDARIVVSPYPNYQILVVDPDSGQPTARLAGQRYEISDAALSPDGQRLVTCGGDQYVALWELSSGRRLSQFSSGTRWAMPWKSVDFAPDGASIVVGNHPLRNTPANLFRYDPTTGERLEQFTEQSVAGPGGLAFDGDGTHLAVTLTDGPTLLWNVERAEPLRWLTKREESVNDTGRVVLSADARRMAVEVGNRIELFNIETGSQFSRPLGHAGSIELFSRGRHEVRESGFAIVAIAMSADGRLAAATGHGGRMSVWEVDSGRLLAHAARELGDLQHAYGRGVVFSPDSGSVLWAVAGKDGRETWSTPLRPGAAGTRLDTGGFSATPRDTLAAGRLLFARSAAGGAAVHDAATRRLVCEIAAGATTASFATARETDRILSLARGSVLRRYDGQTCQELDRWEFPGAQMIGLVASADGRRAAAIDVDGTVRIMNLVTGASYSIVVAGREWFVYTDDGLFDASRGGGHLVTFVRDGEVLLAEDLSALYNRPDLILARTGLGSPAAIAEFSGLYRARVQSLRLHDRAARLPRLPTVRLLRVVVSKDRAEVAFEADSPGSELLRADVYVDGVAVSPVAGIPAQGPRQAFSWQVELEPGQHRLEVSATNREGGESHRAYQTVHGPAQSSEKPRLYYVGIGVSRYHNAAYDLRYATKDVEDLGVVLSAMRGHFSEVRALLLTDDLATRENVERARGFVADARPIDTLLVFAAGHALHADRYYFLTHETDLGRLAQTATPFSTIEALVDRVPPRHKLLLVDACHSGDLPPDGLTFDAPPEAARGLEPRLVRALALDRQRFGIPLPESIVQGDGDRHIHRRLHVDHGATELGSSRGDEWSYEFVALRNGAFTRGILQALTTRAADQDDDGLVDPDELRRYVGQEVARMTAERQHPDVRAENREATVRLPVVAQAAAVLARPHSGLRSTLPDGFTPFAGGARGLTLATEVEADAQATAAAPCVPPVERSVRGCGCAIPGGVGADPWSFGAALGVLLAGARRRRPSRREQSEAPR